MSSNIEVQRICEHCNQSFTARTTKTRYCSHACNSRAYKASVRGLKIEASNKQTLETIARPIEEIKQKAYLSISETCKLIGVSRRTIYRMLDRGELTLGKAGRRTIIKRNDIDQLFIKH